MDDELQLFSVDAGGLVPARRVVKSDDEWRHQLAPEAYRVTRQNGTERAFSGTLWDHHGEGVYRCVGCGNELFTSAAKYDSGSGWPSFFEPLHPANLKTRSDASLGMARTEVLCARCDAHLGHLFPDGPRPTGLRYCVNSVALDYVDRDRG